VRILLDVDGPLADFTTALCDALRRRGHDSVYPDKIQHWCLKESLGPAVEDVDDILCTKGFVRSLPWVEGAPFLIVALQAIADVVCVTSPWPSKYWVPERVEWLSPWVHADDVLFVRSKRKALISGDVLVEDHPGIAAAWLDANPNGRAILVDRPWNRPGAKEFVEHPRLVRAATMGAVYALVQS
jgi:5'(3')-deoxyribonucleotidase